MFIRFLSFPVLKFWNWMVILCCWMKHSNNIVFHLYVSHFSFHEETQRGNGSRTSTRQGRGNATGLHTGVKQRGSTTGNQTGGNNEKMRNVTFVVGKQEKAACATHWNFKIVQMCSIIVRYFQNGFLSINCVHNQLQNIQWFIFKVLQKKDFFFKNVFVKIFRKMRLYP